LTVLVMSETGKLERDLTRMHFTVQSGGCDVTNLEVAPFEADASHTAGFYNLAFSFDKNMLTQKREKKTVEITIAVSTSEGRSAQTSAEI
jgi:hypothetical protein